MNTELRPIHPLTGSNKHGKNAMITGFRLSEINTSLEFIIRKHTLEHENYMLQELNKKTRHGMNILNA